MDKLTARLIDVGQSFGGLEAVPHPRGEMRPPLRHGTRTCPCVSFRYWSCRHRRQCHDFLNVENNEENSRFWRNAPQFYCRMRPFTLARLFINRVAVA